MTKIEQGGYQRGILSKNLVLRDLSGGGSAFEMELLTSFLENITCCKKKFRLLEEISRGDIWGNVWQLGVGESRGGGKCETMAMTGEEGILILVQDFIRGKQYFGASDKSLSNCYFTPHF